jgi:hypothetical protein
MFAIVGKLYCQTENYNCIFTIQKQNYLYEQQAIVPPGNAHYVKVCGNGVLFVPKRNSKVRIK